MHLFLGKIAQEFAELDEKESHHLQKVLRLKTGDEVGVTDGMGNIYKGKVQDISARNVIVSDLIQLENNQKRNYRIEMVVAPTKQMDRIENFLEKAVEIGLDVYHPITTFHSERRKINHERLEKIATAAMKQSLKAEKTHVEKLCAFENFVKNNHFSGQKFIAHCHEDLEIHAIKEVINPNISYQFLIGPEGDFSQEEISLAIAHGYIPITLGEQRMRTATAALGCVFLAHYLHL